MHVNLSQYIHAMHLIHIIYARYNQVITNHFIFVITFKMYSLVIELVELNNT